MNDNKTLLKGRKLAKRLKSFRGDMISWFLIIPSLFCLTLFLWRPSVIGVLYSFFDLQGFEPIGFAGVEHYKVVLQNTQFVKILLNTLQYVFYSTVFGFIPPIIIAIMLNELRVFRKSLKFAIYFPTIVPAIVGTMLWKLMYRPDLGGLLNGVLNVFGIEPQLWLNDPNMVIPCIAVSAAWNGIGGGMIYYFAALQGVNSELYEAAVIDGASVLKRVWNVTIPQISGVILLMFVRHIIGVFTIMEAPLVMTDGGPNGASLTMGLQVYRYAFENYQIPNALALGVVEFLMLIGFTVFYFKMQNKIEN